MTEPPSPPSPPETGGPPAGGRGSGPPDSGAPQGSAASAALAKLRHMSGFIFSLPGLVVAIVAGLGGILGFWSDIRPYLFGPKLELRLTECTGRMISLSVQNKGGRPAVVRAPTFQRFRNGAWEDLPMEEFVGESTFKDEHSRIPADGGYVLSYPSRDVKFFSPEWWRGQSCPVRAQMADVSSGPSQVVEAECPCAQSR